MEKSKMDIMVCKTEFRVQESIMCGEGVSNPTTPVLKSYF